MIHMLLGWKEGISQGVQEGGEGCLQAEARGRGRVDIAQMTKLTRDPCTVPPVGVELRQAPHNPRTLFWSRRQGVGRLNVRGRQIINENMGVTRLSIINTVIAPRDRQSLGVSLHGVIESYFTGA